MIPPTIRRYLPVLVLVLLVAAGLFLFPERPPAEKAGAVDQPLMPAAEYAFMFLKMMAILGGICGLAWLTLRWWLPRFYGSAGSPTRHIQVIETHRLDNHRNLLLVRVGEETFLLAAADRDLRFLARLDKELPAPAGAPAGNEAPAKTPFEALLRKEP